MTKQNIKNLFCAVALFAVPAMGFAATTSFEELASVFDHAVPATQQDLLGAFLGECRVSPQVKAYETRAGYTRYDDGSLTVLMGHIYPNGMHAGMFTNPDLDQTILKYPNQKVELYTADYREKKNLYLKALTKIAPVRVENGHLKTDLDLPYMGYQEFRKSGWGLISESVGVSGGPAEILGVQLVCYWYQRIE